MKLDDRQILRRAGGRAPARRAGDGPCGERRLHRLADRGARAAGHTAPKYHADSRPMAVEREATHRAIALSEVVDVPILIVHVSGREAIEQIGWAHAHGLRIYAETCPQYLFLTADDLDAGLRGRQVHLQPAAARQGQPAHRVGRASRTASSPWSPPTMRPSASTTRRARSRAARSSPFHYIPNGMPGLETRLPLLFSEGVRTGRITLNQFVALTATNPREALRPVSAQGHHRDRLRCRHRDLGPGQAGHHRPSACCITTWTTRPTRACR